MFKEFKAMLLALVLAGHGGFASGQARQLSIDSCYALARKYYPLTEQQGLIDLSRDYTLGNIQTGHLPQLSLQGRASYQSDVTRLPVHLAGVSIPELSKDQYRISAELTQNIYDGGEMRDRASLARAESGVRSQQLEVRLYTLTGRVNELFFGILLLHEQLAENGLYLRDIRLGIDKAAAAVKNGAALPSSRDVLEAEFLEASQRQALLSGERTAYARMLGAFIHRDLPDSVVLIAPPVPADTGRITRPELDLFSGRDHLLAAEQQLAGTESRPKVGLFLDAGAGRPGLDMLDNSFRGYYVGGISVTVPISAFYTLKRKKELIGLERRSLATERETFLFDTREQLTRADDQIRTLREMLASDERIVTLRNRIRKASLAQLENGVITSDDYLRRVHQADQAARRRAYHQVELLMTRYARRNQAGQ